MVQPGLVSVISPCYNVAAYITYFFESLVNQTYKNLEIILVNDGSTDDTDAIIKDWLPKLECAGYLTKYLVKENGGQTSAINEALPYFTGEFLTWVDPDDVLYADSIALRVEYLNKYSSIGFVRSECDVFSENDRNKIVRSIRGQNRNIHSENIFEDLILENTYVTCHCYMVRSKVFTEVNPTRSIYVRKEAGQNWQMLLPIAAKYECGYLPISLCGYIVRAKSHFHSNADLESKLKYYSMSIDVINNTLQSLEIDRKRLDNRIDIHFTIKRYLLGLEYQNSNLVYTQLMHLEKIYGLSCKQRMLKLVSSINAFGSMVFTSLHLMKRLTSKTKYFAGKFNNASH